MKTRGKRIKRNWREAKREGEKLKVARGRAKRKREITKRKERK